MVDLTSDDDVVDLTDDYDVVEVPTTAAEAPSITIQTLTVRQCYVTDTWLIFLP